MDIIQMLVGGSSVIFVLLFILFIAISFKGGWVWTLIRLGIKLLRDIAKSAK